MANARYAKYKSQDSHHFNFIVPVLPSHLDSKYEETQHSDLESETNDVEK
jgi:hypothetical protein